jgi:hypothetical protein
VLSLLCVLGYGQKIDTVLVQSVHTAKPFILFGKRSNGMVLSLEKIFVKDKVFFFGYKLINKSALSYPVELLRLFIRDKTSSKRSSSQEIECVPLYADSVLTVSAYSFIRFVIAVSKFTIPDKKVCQLELFETHGGRNLSLDITNRQLFLARPFSDSVILKK